MIVDRIRTTDDVNVCVNMYYDLNDHSFLYVEKRVSTASFLRLLGGDGYFRCVRNHYREILAWSCFVTEVPLHSSVSQFRQLYYASNQNGLAAARCVKLLHRDAVAQAGRLRLRTVISQGSHMDEKNILVKILEKDGWDRRGHTAMYRFNMIEMSPETSTFMSRSP